MDTTQRIADFIVRVGYDDIPSKAIEAAKTSIIDCVGTCLAGSQDPSGRIIAEYIREIGGKPEAGVIAKGFRTCAPEAALANGTMGHALDYDDTSEAFLGHPTTVILPAVLALGERNKISGKEALLSYIVGYEVGAKIGLGMGAAHYDVGWHSTATFGTMAAATACAKILKLDVQRTRVALGIAASLAGGLRQNFGTMTKPLHAGNAARNGVVATLLAKKGFTADQGILEGPLGYAKLFSGKGEYNLERMTQGLGAPFAIDSPRPMIKLYPSCRATAGCIDAILHLVREHTINPADVDEVECRTSSVTPQVLIHSHPQTALEGKFSMQYCMAIAIIDKEAGLKQFTDDKVQNPEVQELISKVKYAHPPEMGSTVSGALRGKVEVVVKLRNGAELCHRVEVAKGDSENPLMGEEIEQKFLDCAELALSHQDAKQCLDMLSNLDSVEDISELMKLLS
ncbi:MmgE/PrpD family protein [Chloroflexota bacterium]